MNDAQLRNVWRNRQRRDRVAPLYEPLRRLMSGPLARRVRSTGQLAAAWEEAVPAELLEQSALVKFNRGTLTVAMPSAAHRYQLRMLLDDGLLAAIRKLAPAAALNRVRLVPGGPEALETDGPAPVQA